MSRLPRSATPERSRPLPSFDARRAPPQAALDGTSTRHAHPGARPSRQLRPLMASNEAVAHPLCRYRLARCHRHPPRRAEILRRSRHRRHPKASAVCASRPCGRPVAAQMQPRLFRHVPRGVRARKSPYAVKADWVRTRCEGSPGLFTHCAPSQQTTRRSRRPHLG